MHGVHCIGHSCSCKSKNKQNLPLGLIIHALGVRCQSSRIDKKTKREQYTLVFSAKTPVKMLQTSYICLLQVQTAGSDRT